MRKHLPLIITFGVGVAIWFFPHPESISLQGWHVFAIFLSTITGIILKPLPMGAVAITSLAITAFTDTLTIDQVLGGYQEKLIWLIVFAFFISKGFIKTQLGTRIGYYFISLFGRRSLGLAYSIMGCELLLAPAIPSVTARTGGVILPIVNAMSVALNSRPKDPSAKRLGSFLVLVCFQGSVITSAMFLTAMAANPAVADLAAGMGYPISWTMWAVGASVPGLVCLIVVPFIIYKIARPTLRELPDAHRIAQEKLAEMGRVSRHEYVMMGVFIGLVGLWIFGGQIGVHSTTAAMLGVSVLLLTGVLKWSELLDEKGAWATLVWFGALLTLAKYLNTFGVVAYFSSVISGAVVGLDWRLAFGILCILYFYSHYIFASSIAHVSAMFTAFFTVAVMMGAPPILVILILAYFSSLYGGLTHYGIGSAPILYASGFVDVGEWWKVGLLVSVVNIPIFIFVGGAWWKYLGYW